MTTNHHIAPGTPIRGRWHQLMAVLTGRAIVTRKGQPEGMDTTEYLLSTPANRDALMTALRDLDEGHGVTDPHR